MQGPLAAGRGELIAPDDRRRAVDLLEMGTAAGAPASGIARILGVSTRTLRRWREEIRCSGSSIDGRKGAPRRVAHKLTAEERQQVIDTVNDPRFADLTPAQIIAILAEEGVYIASEMSFYRIMREEGLLHHRGSTRPPREPRPVPRLEASGPNQIWSWDITLLPSRTKGKWHYLYMVMDVWSRKIVAAEVHERECGKLAARLIEKACSAEGLGEDEQPVLHSDNGGPMRSFTLAAKLRDLGIDQSFSRPRVSNDNPFSEALFRTLKVHPSYPARWFRSLESVIEWVKTFVAWYNGEHRHSGIKYVTPSQRHHGLADAICEVRRRTYEKAYRLHPARWSRHQRCWKQPEVVWINHPRPLELLAA